MCFTTIDINYIQCQMEGNRPVLLFVLDIHHYQEDLNILIKLSDFKLTRWSTLSRVTFLSELGRTRSGSKNSKFLFEFEFEE